MVYYKDTLELCHEPTAYGKKVYQEFLQKKADEILYKHDHPLKYAIQKLLELIKGE